MKSVSIERDGNSLGTSVEEQAADELHRAMLHLWDRLRELAARSDVSETEITIAIEEFSVAWQLMAGPEIVNGPGRIAELREEQLPRAFARLLYKRLRLQHQEFSKRYAP